MALGKLDRWVGAYVNTVASSVVVAEILEQDLETFFYKGPDSKYFKRGGHKVSVTTAQLCSCSRKLP